MPKKTIKKPQKKKPNESGFLVRRNHDYTISIEDQQGHVLTFRDITGNDLEFLDLLLLREDNTIKQRIILEEIVKILSRLSIIELDFNNLQPRILQGLFLEINKHILCNYVPKYTWLKICYEVQNGSFAGVSIMEKTPMTKFIAMSEIHQEAIKSIDKPE